MTYEDGLVKMGTGICISCGKKLVNNAADCPEAMKVIALELQAYSQQKINLSGPDQWMCYSCIRKIMKNALESTERFNNLE